MHYLITEIEKSIGLPPNWKSYPEIYKKFEWIEKIEDDKSEVIRLKDKLDNIGENWCPINDFENLENENYRLRKILDQNEIDYD